MKNRNLKVSTMVVLFIAIVMGSTSCTDATRAKIGGYGDEFKVEMINCDGTVAREWISSGKVQSEANSDGYYFNDKKTGKLIEVTGRMVITKQQLFGGQDGMYCITHNWWVYEKVCFDKRSN